MMKQDTGKGNAGWRTIAVIAAIWIPLVVAPADPVLAVAKLIVQIAGVDQAQIRAAVTIVAPDGSTQNLADDDRDGVFILEPATGAGDYQVTITANGESETRTVALPPSGLATITFIVDGPGDRIRIAYSGDAFGSDEIIVTARKREESIQSIPLAITAFTETMMEAQSMRDLHDVGEFTPNVDFSLTAGITGAPSEATVYIRGIGQIASTVSADPGVGIYVDGVYVPRAQGAVLDLLDLERVEVLRGPQETLFGKNTIGGAISLISRKPHEEFSGYVDLTLGAFDRRDLRVKVNAPLTDRLFGSVAASMANRDGFSESLASGEKYNDDNHDAARLALRWIASDNVIVDIAGDYMRERESALNMPMIAIENTALLNFYNTAAGDAGLPTLTDAYVTNDLRTSYSTALNQNHGDVGGLALTTNWSLGNINLKSISAYREIKFVVSVDADGSPVPYLERTVLEDQEQVSQEFQLNGTSFDGRWNWVVGSLFFSEKARSDDHQIVMGGLFEALEAAPGPIYAPPGLPNSLCSPGPAPPGMPCFGGSGNPANMAFFTGEGNNIIMDFRTNSYAGFGEGTFAITEKLHATAGIRYTYEEKEFDYFNQNANGAPEVKLYNKDHWDAWSPRVTVAYQAKPELYLYASIARGFKSGTFNSLPQNRNVLDPVDPETAWTYEAGFKTDAARGRLRLNGTFFYNDYTDMQFQAHLDVEGETVFVVKNAGKARVLGAEMEMTARPAPGWLVTGALGFADAEYTDLEGVAAVTLDGKFPKTPEWTFNFSPQYSYPLRAIGEIVIRGDYSYRSEVFNDITNSPQVAQAGYGIVNARLSYLPSSEAWEVALFGTNLSDEEYIEHGAFVSSLGHSVAVGGRPREWGLSVQYRF